MTPLSLSGPQHRALWHKLAMLREAYNDLELLCEHYRYLGYGDIHRRLENDYAKVRAATLQLAAVLEEAAGDQAVKQGQRA